MQVILLPPRRAGGPRYLQTAQPHLDPWGDDGANFPVNPFPNIRRTQR